MYKFLILLFLSLILNSCGVYLPQSSDIPLINKKNDLRIDAGVSTIGTAGTATVSYGVSNNLAVQGYGTIHTNDRYFFHGALGYYKNLKNRNVMEIYGGFGKGYGFSNNHDTQTDISGNYQTYFAQFNFGKIGGKTSLWDFGISMKPGLLHSNLVQETLLLDGSGSVISTPMTGNNFFVEPSLFTRVGGEHVKLSIKLGGLYVRNSENRHFPYFLINLGVGLNFRL